MHRQLSISRNECLIKRISGRLHLKRCCYRVVVNRGIVPIEASLDIICIGWRSHHFNQKLLKRLVCNLPVSRFRSPLKRVPKPNPQLFVLLPKHESTMVVKSVGVVTLTTGINLAFLGKENLDFAVLKLI